MLQSSFSIRNYRPGEIDDFIALYRKCKSPDEKEEDFFHLNLSQGIVKPGYSPEHDLFLAENKGRLTGWLNIVPEMNIKRAILSGSVCPVSRGHGIGSMLLEKAMKRAEDLKIHVLHVNISSENQEANVFLKKAGFSATRYYLDLKANIFEMPLDKFKPEGMEFFNFRPGQESFLAELQNECFKGTWGFSPNAEDDIRYYLALTSSTLKDVVVARMKDQVVGYCWTHLVKRKFDISSREKGRIHMFGIKPGYRGKGFGKSLLVAGLGLLKKKKVETIELTVDKENAAARFIYSSLGFKTASESVWFEKNLSFG